MAMVPYEEDEDWRQQNRAEMYHALLRSCTRWHHLQWRWCRITHHEYVGQFYTHCHRCGLTDRTAPWRAALPVSLLLTLAMTVLLIKVVVDGGMLWWGYPMIIFSLLLSLESLWEARPYGFRRDRYL